MATHMAIDIMIMVDMAIMAYMGSMGEVEIMAMFGRM